MSRQVKNAKDIVTGELVYFVSHAKATYLGDGSTVEDTVNVMKRDIKNITLSNEATTMVSVTYEELKNLRDNGELVPGMQYRITDYVTTTAQENTRSAGHLFDLIVTADDVNVLNENARAIQHDGDTYFADSDLNAWQIWYSLDNDEERFAWAANPIYNLYGSKMIMTIENNTTWIYIYNGYSSIDNKHEWYWNADTKNLGFKDGIDDSGNGSKFLYTDTEFPNAGDTAILYTTDNDTYTNVPIKDVSFKEGKGVIYRMIDEWNNDCPYDFKNIELYRDYSWKKTFSISSNSCTNNTINSFYESGTMMIPIIIFSFESYCHNNVIKSNCNNILLGTTTGQGTNLMNNTIGYGCYNLNINCFDIFDNIFGDYCHDFAIQSQTFTKNKIGLRCSSIQMSMYTIENTTIGSDCSLITDYNSRNLENCTIGDFCTDLHVGGTDFKVGNNCTDLYIDGIGCKIGNNCSTIYIFGNHVIGNNCNNINLSHTKSKYNTNFVGDNCHQINTKGAQMNHCHFGSGCNNINKVAGCSADCVIFENGTGNINVSLFAQLGDEYIIKSGNYNGKFLSNYTLREYPCSYATITYDNLITLRDNGNLTKGAKYQIIDYVTSTSQENTKSAEHQFDIIVTALNEYTLSEEAQAIQNYYDGYFDESNLSAWKIWYSLDNDTKRFAWAGDERIETAIVNVVDTSNCTISVGYSYDDEEGLNKFDNRVSFISQVWNDPANEAYLEGSAIDELITHWGYETDPNGIENCLTLYGLNLEFDEETGEITSEDGMSEDRWYYRGIVTVDGTDYDYWEKAEWGGDNGELCYMDQNENCSEKLFFLTNRIVSGEPTFTTTTVERVIPLEPKGVIYRMIDEFGNDCPYDFKNIQFKRKLTNGVLDTENGVDTYCYTFNAYCGEHIYDASIIAHRNVIEDDTNRCHGNIIKEYYQKHDYVKYLKLNNIVLLNTYDATDFELFHCYSNSFGNNCYNNSFGNNCYNNSFGNDCYNNSFGNDCYNNSFGNSCTHNTFGRGCNDNSFGNHCYSNSFGVGCNYNSFSNYCFRNYFGNYCNSNSFGNYCNDNKFRLSASTTGDPLNYCYSNHFDDGCSYNVIWNDVQPNHSNKLQNINVVRGVSGSYISSNFINIVDKNAAYEIKVAKNSKGEIKIYCEADLIK